VKKRWRRLLDLVAPVRPPGAERGYRRLLRWAALPVTDRRWAAPLAALALGFGLFAGVAIGPGATGTLATGAPQVIELPSLLAGGDGEEGEVAEAGGGGEHAFAEGGEAALPEGEASSSAFETSFPEAEEATESPAPEPAPTEEEPADEAEAEEPAQVMGGVVVHANPAAGSYTVAEAGGLMNAIHTAELPVPGTRVSVPVRTLANGTYAEDGKRKQSGRRTSATIAGVVTFVDADPAAPAYAVSKRGTSVLVHVHPDPTGVAPALPQLGAYATVAVAIERAPAEPPPPPAAEPPAVPPPAPPAPADAPAALPLPAPACAPDPARPPSVPFPTALLWQSGVDADGAPFASSDFEGVVTAICPSEAKLALSGDDLRQSGKEILFTVPRGIDLRGLKLGDSVAASAKFEADGALTLTGLASDERTKGADDATATQGDLASHKPK
jgi:hypothetical protein